MSKYWKLNENLILNIWNDFDKPYIVIAIASWHLLIDTASDSFLRSISVIKLFIVSPGGILSS